MSIAGNTRLSATFRSSTISELPVPLNSSKITSSIRLPVSISAVAMIVSDPPSSMFRAAPKNRFGRCSAFASTPPVNTLPEEGPRCCNARPSRVMESSRITTSRPCSTSRLAFSITISATCDMPRRRFVKGRGHHLALHRALHIRHLLRPLIDQQNDEKAFRMIAFDRMGDVLQQHRLTGARRRHDQSTAAPCRSATPGR